MEARVYLSGPEVAKKLSVSTARVRQFRLEGRLKGFSIGSHAFYTPEDVEKFMRTPRPNGRPRWKNI